MGFGRATTFFAPTGEPYRSVPWEKSVLIELGHSIDDRRLTQFSLDH